MYDPPIIVNSCIPGNEGIQFKTVLPILASPWPSMGTKKVLAEIGELVDALPVGGSEEPAWDTAMKVAELHVQAMKDLEGSGLIKAAPIYFGRTGTWDFTAEIFDGGSSSQVWLHIGRYVASDGSYFPGRFATVINQSDPPPVGFDRPYDRELKENLQAAGITWRT